ncbi:hypothetical protein [Rubinisphaera margarita]|uniref:hypothetical protein n=1 Tax=Rubinisphaera margarita TaxID=2909586 RepID=UPI001EE82508|nr:hypothetical protein [Rubinisphaera margarita]MCG6156767.1 hypothetical protein [Rubinisphaera margarita]
MREYRVHDYYYLFQVLDGAIQIQRKLGWGDYLRGTVENCMRYTERLQLSITHAHLQSARQRLGNGVVGDEHFEGILLHIKSARNSLMHETERLNVAVLNDDAISARVKNLTQIIGHNAFYLEMLQCLRVEAFRATIVNAWALCMDYLQGWIVNRRLQEFNADLTKVKDRKGKFYSPVTEKADFWTGNYPNERLVIDKIRPFIGDPIHRRIVLALDERNEFAHANGSQLDLDKTRGYVSQIIDVIEQLDKRS